MGHGWWMDIVYGILDRDSPPVPGPPLKLWPPAKGSKSSVGRSVERRQQQQQQWRDCTADLLAWIAYWGVERISCRLFVRVFDCDKDGDL